LSVALAIVALAGALTFAASLAHLLNNPRQYGWNWDLDASNTQEEGKMDNALKLLENDPLIEAAAGVDTPPVRIEDVPLDAIALSQRKGTIEPIVVDGRAPRAPNEVALGVRTLREAHAKIGSKVHMTIAAISGSGADFTVVGTVVIPPNSDTAGIGGGGVITYDGEKRMAPPGFTNFPPTSRLYIRLAPGVDPHAARERLEAMLEGYVFAEPTRPVDLVNFGQVQNLPLLLAGLVAVLAAATLGHTLITAIRRRRRDLAILKMIGFVPRQVRTAVSWQATTFVSACDADRTPPRDRPWEAGVDGVRAGSRADPRARLAVAEPAAHHPRSRCACQSDRRRPGRDRRPDAAGSRVASRVGPGARFRPCARQLDIAVRGLARAP
jgi:hypothetical protein